MKANGVFVDVLTGISNDVAKGSKKTCDLVYRRTRWAPLPFQKKSLFDFVLGWAGGLVWLACKGCAIMTDQCTLDRWLRLCGARNTEVDAERLC